MGLLAESKSRNKISKDPNNTKWTRDTNTFGQKILRAQGWQPGQYLGAHNAAQADSYSAANASYIRVTLKDDMKGLGFDKAKADEITGLDVFSDLLSRLNGKSDEAVEGDRQARLAVKTHRYVEAKWGPMRFVRGGLLIGDELREESESNESEPEETKKPKAEKKSKKRKAAEAGDAEPSEDTEKAEKRRRKEERRAKKAAAASEGEEERKSKKKSKSKKESYPDGTVSDDAERVKRKSKKEKKSRSESDERCEKKDKTKKKKVSADSGEVAMEDAADSPATGTSTPTESGTGTSTPRGSRNFVRSRFIAQKRQAVLDAKALNQIFMLKT